MSNSYIQTVNLEEEKCLLVALNVKKRERVFSYPQQLETHLPHQNQPCCENKGHQCMDHISSAAVWSRSDHCTAVWVFMVCHGHWEKEEMGWKKEPGCQTAEDPEKRLWKKWSQLTDSVGTQKGSRTLGDSGFEPTVRKVVGAGRNSHQETLALNPL